MRGLLIIPGCNEELSLKDFLPRLNRVLAALPYDQFETLFVDDGSEDASADVARENGCAVLRHEVNQGLGASLRDGYREAVRRGVDFVVTMDSDGQHDPELLQKFLEELRSGAELVIGSRYHPESERVNVPFDRDLLNMSTRTHLEIATGWNLTDPLAGFWVMNRRVIEFVAKETTFPRYGTCIENLVKFWFLMRPRPKIVEVPHPAIYGNHGSRAYLNRDYSLSRRPDRIQRFTDHAGQVLDALDEVRKVLGSEVVDREVELRRAKWCSSERRWSQAAMAEAVAL